MDGEKTLSVRAADRLDADALAAYGAIVRRFDTSGGLASVADILHHCDFYEVLMGSRVVARYALRVNLFEHGAEGDIVAAVGHVPGVDLTASLLPYVERQFNNVNAVKVETRRKQLVNKLLMSGYELQAFILRKRVR